LSADDLVDIIRRDDRHVSRATVYRTLQWMVDAGIARKVDFGEGLPVRAPTIRVLSSHLRPVPSFEFLSSDNEALPKALARPNFTALRGKLVIQDV
jgi:hypothetical protein